MGTDQTLVTAGWTAPPPAPRAPMPTPPSPRSGRVVLVLVSALGGAALMAGGVLIGRSSASGEASAPPATVVVAASTTTPSVTAPSPSTTGAPATTVLATIVPATIGDPTAGSVPSTAPTTVPPLPGELRADFTWTPEAPTAGSSIRFVDQSSGSPAFWEFRWRRNSITTSRPPNVATNLSEDTEVTLTVCSDRERTHCDTITKLIDVA